MTLLSSYSLSFNYAGFGKRCVAFIIDFLVINFGLQIINLLTGVEGNSAEEGLRILAIGVTVSWFYYAAMESSTRQATLGKIAMAIIVVDLNGKPVSFGRASVRYFCKILSACLFGVGFFMAAFTRRRQGLHDLIAQCLIINEIK